MREFSPCGFVSLSAGIKRRASTRNEGRGKERIIETLRAKCGKGRQETGAMSHNHIVGQCAPAFVPMRHAFQIQLDLR